jgi:hypothetical protein
LFFPKTPASTATRLQNERCTPRAIPTTSRSPF